MTQIVLTCEQMHQLASATDDVEIAHGQGNVIVRFPAKISQEEAAIIDGAKKPPGFRPTEDTFLGGRDAAEKPP